MKRISAATVTFGVMAVVLGLVAAYIVKQAMHKPEVATRDQPTLARSPAAEPKPAKPLRVFDRKPTQSTIRASGVMIDERAVRDDYAARAVAAPPGCTEPANRRTFVQAPAKHC